MALFTWDPRFDLGVGSMNDEHKVLMDLMNDLYERNNRKAPKGEMMSALKKLGAYTVKHFEDEERYMQSIGYDGLATHQLIHKQLLKSFAEQVRAYEAAKGEGLPDSLFTFLKGWLQAHICGIDRKYADHARTRPARAA